MDPAISARHDPGFIERWTTYLHERFPLPQYGAALGAFSWAALAYARGLARESGWPSAIAFVAAFLATLLFFLQLRILDEFKDAEEDAKYRPHRPLPRGLVTRGGLARVYVIAGVVELALAASIGLEALAFLVIALAYSGLMGAEFFARDWLRARAALYLASHMLIVPLLALFVFACSGTRPSLLAAAPFLAFAYFSFCVFELGRKTWAPSEEKVGVETYSALWGPRRAVRAWIGVTALAAAAGGVAASQVGIVVAYAVVATLLVAATIVTGVRFLRGIETARGHTLLAMSGAWMIGMFLVFGIAGGWRS